MRESDAAAVTTRRWKTAALASKLVAIALRYAICVGGGCAPPASLELPEGGHSAGKRSPRRLLASTISPGACDRQ